MQQQRDARPCDCRPCDCRPSDGRSCDGRPRHGCPSDGLPGCEPSAAAAGGQKITFVAPLLADANWSGLNACVVSKSKELGYDLTMVAPINETASTADMVSLTEQAIAAGTQGLIVVPLVAESWNDVLASAKSKNIPVIAMGVDTSKPDQRNAFVGTDFNAYGGQSADLVAKYKPNGTVGILYSGPETTNQVDAIKVFRQTIKDKYPNIKIVGDDTILSPGGNRDLVKTTEVARGFMVAHPEVDTIWSPDGQGGIAAAGAARDLGKKPGDITIIGADHLPQVAARPQGGLGVPRASPSWSATAGARAASRRSISTSRAPSRRGPPSTRPPRSFTKENP